MSTNTSRLSLPVAIGTDKRINWPTTDAAAKAILDAAAITVVATHAGRPGANTVPDGTYLYESDTKANFRSDGSTWQSFVANASITSTQLKPTAGVAKGTGGGVTLSATWTDVAGTSVTIVPAVASTVIVTGNLLVSGGANDTAALALNVDGSRQSDIGSSLASGVSSGTIGHSWAVALTAASHTLKLQASGSGSAGPSQAFGGGSSMAYFLIAS